MFGSIGKWLKGATELNELMSRIDKNVHALTGVNPKTFHPELYQLLMKRIMIHNERHQASDGRSINEFEGALLMLYLLRTVAEESGNSSPIHRTERYEAAIKQLRIGHADDIGPTVGLDCFSM